MTTTAPPAAELTDTGLVDVRLPRISNTSDEGAVVRWFVSPGQRVAEGDVLAEIAAGTVTMEIEAAQDGVLSTILQPAGSPPLAIGTVIAHIAPVAPAAALSVPTQAASDFAVETRPDAPASSHGASSELTYAAGLRAGLVGRMRRDPRIFVIGESVADFGRCSAVVQGLAEEFGTQRVCATPITPHAVVGLAVGAAMAGLRPVVEVTAWSLALQALDPIVQSAATTRYRSGGTQGVSLVLRGRNGLWSGAGPMHGVSLASWFAHVPGLKVVCPATPACAKGLMAAAIDDPDPVVVLEPDALYECVGPVPDSDDWYVAIGAARLACEGDDITIVTYGQGVAIALAAAESLARSKVSAEVVDLRSLRPLDTATVLRSVRKTGRLLTLDDGWPVCSIGSEICATVVSQAFSALRTQPVRMEAADVPVPYAANLEALVIPDADEVAAKALRMTLPAGA